MLKKRARARARTHTHTHVYRELNSYIIRYKYLFQSIIFPFMYCSELYFKLQEMSRPVLGFKSQTTH